MGLTPTFTPDPPPKPGKNTKTDFNTLEMKAREADARAKEKAKANALNKEILPKAEASSSRVKLGASVLGASFSLSFSLPPSLPPSLRHSLTHSLPLSLPGLYLCHSLWLHLCPSLWPFSGELMRERARSLSPPLFNLYLSISLRVSISLSPLLTQTQQTRPPDAQGLRT